MKSLRVLLVMVEPPLPFGNAAGRWFYVLLKGLVERGHHVTAFATCSKEEEIEQTTKIFPASQYDLRCYGQSERCGVLNRLKTAYQPYSYMFGDQLKRDLTKELVRGFDILHLEQLWSGWLGLNYINQTLINIHYLFEIDFAQSASTSMIDWLRRMATYRAERRLLRKYRYLSTLTSRLATHAKQVNPIAVTHTIPLGLDLSLYPFEEESRRDSPPTVGLIGSFNWGPTYSAGVRLLTRLWPEIKRQVPNAHLQIVGREARAMLASLAQEQDIAIYENVPDIVPYFRNLDVLLYPTPRGSGMKVKVLEAFALGVPVVTTNDGIEGLPAIDGIQCGICEDDAGLIDRTVILLRDAGLRLMRRRAARELLEKHCTADFILNKLEYMYREIIGKDGSPTSVNRFTEEVAR